MRCKSRSAGFTLVELLVSITILAIIGIAFATMFGTAGTIFRQSVQDERNTQAATSVLDDLTATSDIAPVVQDQVKVGLSADGTEATGATATQLGLTFTVDGKDIAVDVNGSYYDAQITDSTGSERILRVFCPNAAQGLGE